MPAIRAMLRALESGVFYRDELWPWAAVGQGDLWRSAEAGPGHVRIRGVSDSDHRIGDP